MIAPWAQEEMASVNLRDSRLDDRAVVVLSALGERPNLSIPAACGGGAEMDAAYRFFNNGKVTLDRVVEPHLQRTGQRIAEQSVVLLVQDTTEIDLTRPEQQVTGVGTLDRSRRGFFLHLLHAFTTEGTPLGTLSVETLNRTQEVSDATAAQKEHQRKHVPIEEKESLRWLTGLREARDLAQSLPQVQCVCIADSEGDIYELLCEPRGDHPVHWLIRACQDRALEPSTTKSDTAHLREQVLATPVLYEMDLLIRSRQAKIAGETRARRQSRPQRQARVQVRAATLTLRPPWRFDRQLPAVSVNVVLVSESHPPPGEEPVQWLLLTTLPIDTLEQVRAIVEYYCVRWQIEIVFRTLKSGCRVEKRRFEHIDRILPYLGICLIVAWRTLFLCRMGRVCPDIDCEAIFEPSEWKAVWSAVHGQPLPKQPPRLQEMIHLVARLGGYVERADSPPGPQTLWIGLQRMYDLAWAWDSFGPEAKRGIH
jgi:hypothetical protein